MRLATAQHDRACGTLLATAAGDALGAGYEFDPPRKPDEPVGMIGGGLGPFQPGEWTDDTSMAIAIAEVAATGADLESEVALDAVVTRWHEWSKTAKDVGVQTRAVLAAAGRRGIGAHSALQESAALHQRSGRTAGNGSLMRTAPVELAYVDDEVGLVAASRKVSQLTHYDLDAGDACVPWCTAIRRAVLTGQLDAWIGLGHLDADRRELWDRRRAEAESAAPSAFRTTTAGRWPRCRERRRRSPRPQRPTMPRLRESFAPITCDWHWRPRCAVAGTPTPSPRLPVDCSAPSTVLGGAIAVAAAARWLAEVCGPAV